MTNRNSKRSTLFTCVLSIAYLFGATVFAQTDKNPVPPESINFELLGSVDTAVDGTPANSRAYSKIAPWPFTEQAFSPPEAMKTALIRRCPAVSGWLM